MSEDAAALDGLLRGREPIPDETRAALLQLTGLVRTWSRKTDLVRVRSAPELAELLFLDALALADWAPEGAHVLDVGAGAGAPGLPLALLRRDLDLTLLEPRRRRVTFMRLAAGSLGLGARVTVREDRLQEPTQPELRERFGAAYSRATFAPPEWLRRGVELAPRVAVLLARGEAPDPLDATRIERDETYTVPSSGAPRRLVGYVLVGSGP